MFYLFLCEEQWVLKKCWEGRHCGPFAGPFEGTLYRTLRKGPSLRRDPLKDLWKDLFEGPLQGRSDCQSVGQLVGWTVGRSVGIRLRWFSGHLGPPFTPPPNPLKTYHYSGIIIRVLLCWNFGRLVPGAVKSHRCSTKTHESYHLCALFGHKISSN